jgi:acyl-coenzyme A thioesterase PaaI-like protein
MTTSREPHDDEQHTLPPEPPEVLAARQRAAAALRRLGHAVVGHECDPILLEQVAARADRIAAEVELGTPRSRPIESIKRRLWETAPPDGGPMSHFEECIVSGRANPMGIGLQVRRDGMEVVGTVTLGSAFEGAPKRAHGGVTAAIFDDVMGYVLLLYRTPAYTGELTVRYKGPVPVGSPLEVRSWLRERDGRKLTMESAMSFDGEVICEAEGLFIAIPPERLGIDPDALPR